MTEKTLTFDAPRGRRPVLQNIPIAELAVDATYQRSIENGPSQALIRRIATRWDWGLCQPLVVSSRDSGAALFVIDGQHRLEAAKLRGDIGDLPCVVMAYPDAASEAANFVELNQRRRPLNAIELFRAAVAGGEAEALEVVDAVEAAGLSIATHTNNSTWKPGQIGNVGGLRIALKRHGKQTLTQALTIMGQAFYGQQIRFAGTLFPGIAALCAAGDSEGLMQLLRARSQEQWRSLILQARAADPNLDAYLASVRVLQRELRASLGQSGLKVSKPQPMFEPTPVVSFKPGADGKTWCDQCDARVTAKEASACRDRHCSMRKV